MTDRWMKKAYDLGTDIRSMVAMSGVDPIHHIQEVDDALATALSDAYEAGRREEREACAVVAKCHSDDRPGRDRNFDWNDGYIDGCRGAAAAIRSREAGE